MTLSEISKLPRKGSEYSPSHRLWVGGENFTENLRTASINYTADGGGSGCQVAMRGDISDYDNAPLVLHLGYGEEVVPYFVGRLQRPNYNSRLDYTTATAFGPYRLMATQLLDEEKSFFGYTLRNALTYLTQKAKYRRGEVEIRGGGDYIVEDDTLYVWNNTLGEVASSLMDRAKFIGMDQPVGKRLFRKLPRPGVSGTVKETYGPDEYPMDAFSPEPSTETSYTKVVVERVSAEGEVLGKYTQAVGSQSQFSPLSGSIYPIPDFIGTPEQAQQEAWDTAMYLRLGAIGFGFSGLALNPTLELYDVLKISQVHRDRLYSYKCMISGDLNAEYAAATRDAPGQATMDMSGTALQLVRGEEI
jgi:hypothetical protein